MESIVCCHCERSEAISPEEDDLIQPIPIPYPEPSAANTPKFLYRLSYVILIDSPRHQPYNEFVQFATIDGNLNV